MRKSTTVVAVAASILLACPLAIAADDPSCFATSDSTPPEGYAERCLGGQPAAPAPAGVSGFVPGDIAYYQRLTPAPVTLMTAPLPTYNFTTIGTNSRSTFAMDFDNTATTLYAVDNVTRELGTINQTTGAFTVVAAIQGIPAGLNVRGLRFDPTSTSVYLLFGANLYTLNITTGATTLIGVTTGTVIDIAIDNAGVMYGNEITLDNLVRIDKTTAATTVVGPTGINSNFAQGMDVDPSDNTLYGFAFVITPVQQGHLVRFNTTTGAATILATRPEELEGAIKVPVVPAVTVTPIANSVDASGNGVFQPNETVTMAPTWRNTGSAAVTLTGALSAFGSGPPIYNIVDGAAAYTIAPLSNASCGSNCYSLNITAATRPATHWDTTVLETLNPSATTKTWTLHVGDSFTDVTPSSPFYRFIETILHKNVTGGCSATTYCPLNSTTREQMAVFVLVSKEPAGYTPPACVAPPRFSDVPITSPFCRWIEELARRGVVGGCGGTNFCPTNIATREQMAVFVLRTKDPTLNPPPCVPGQERFADVPASSPFCRWVEELWRGGVVGGCGANLFCPQNPVTREQMSVFLAVTFGLVLYGI